MRGYIAGDRRQLGGDAGYTLIEILVVMAIIGVLVAVLTPGLIGQLGRARAKTAQMQLETIAAGVESFRTDVGHYPTSGEGLAALVSDPGNEQGWTGPYVRDGKVLNDPWGHPVGYQADPDNRAFTVTSLGRDGTAGGTGLDTDLHAPSSP